MLDPKPARSLEWINGFAVIVKRDDAGQAVACWYDVPKGIGVTEARALRGVIRRLLRLQGRDVHSKRST